METCILFMFKNETESAKTFMFSCIFFFNLVPPFPLHYIIMVRGLFKPYPPSPIPTLPSSLPCLSLKPSDNVSVVYSAPHTNTCSLVESDIVPLLEKLSKDDDADVRYFSAEALAAISEHLGTVSME